jgi:RHH-type rel operon transcriptional repressor/antitoxin RelB
MIAVRLPKDIEERLDRLSLETGRTKTFYVREAIMEYLDDLEDIFLAEKRLRDIHEGGAGTISLKDAFRELDIED